MLLCFLALAAHGARLASTQEVLDSSSSSNSNEVLRQQRRYEHGDSSKNSNNNNVDQKEDEDDEEVHFYDVYGEYNEADEDVVNQGGDASSR